MVEQAPSIDEPQSEAARMEQKRQDSYEANKPNEAQRLGMIAALLREYNGYKAKLAGSYEDSDKAKWNDRLKGVRESLKSFGYDGNPDKQEADDSDKPTGATSAQGKQTTR